MKKAIYLLVFLAFTASCKNEVEEVKSEPVEKISSEMVEVATNIIYDVVVQTDSDDAWEKEKIESHREKGHI